MQKLETKPKDGYKPTIKWEKEWSEVSKTIFTLLKGSQQPFTCKVLSDLIDLEETDFSKPLTVNILSFRENRWVCLFSVEFMTSRYGIALELSDRLKTLFTKAKATGKKSDLFKAQGELVESVIWDIILNERKVNWDTKDKNVRLAHLTYWSKRSLKVTLTGIIISRSR